MSGLEHEAGSAVVEDDAGCGADDASPEIIEDRIDERHSVAIGVNDGEKSRIAVIRNGEGCQTVHAPLDRYTSAQLCRALVRQQGLERDLAGARIANEAISIGVGLPPDLGQRMTAFDRKWCPCGGIETFERLQHGERYDALAIWRTFPNLITAVAGSDRCHVFRRIGKKIVERVAAAG